MSRPAPCSRHFVSDDGSTELRVAFEFTAGTPETGRHGRPEDYDPGSGPELFVTRATALGPDLLEVRLTAAEEERFLVETLEDPDFEPFPPRDA